MIIAAVSSMTGPFSQTGLRSLFPMMAPRHLWERVNAIDSSGYVVATIIGPPLAAAMVAILGPRVAVMAIAIPYALAALVLLPVREPKGTPTSSGRLLVDAWLGVRYVWGNRSLRGLGFSISTLNLAGGISTIVIPILILAAARWHGGHGGRRVRAVRGGGRGLGGPVGPHRLAPTGVAAAGAARWPSWVPRRC